MNTIDLKINVNLPGCAKGTVIKIRADDDGVPLDKWWRDRLHDAKHDNCVSIVSLKVTKKSSTKEPEQENK